jgi:hypothetical protein
MNKASGLRDLDMHFAFGRNQASYAGLIGEQKVKEAETGLLQLMSRKGLVGARLLDILWVRHSFSCSTQPWRGLDRRLRQR